MFIKKSVVNNDPKYQKLLILITILLFVAACSDPEVSNEKRTISGEISIPDKSY